MTTEAQSELERMGDADVDVAFARILTGPRSAQERLEDMMERAATKALRKTLSEIGLPIDTPAQREEAKSDMSYLRLWRLIVKKSATTVGTAVLTGFAVAILAVMWAGIRLHILKQP